METIEILSSIFGVIADVTRCQARCGFDTIKLYGDYFDY